MLRAEVQMLAWVSGTIFGREVVPEVCRMSATSRFGGAQPAGLRPRRAGSGMRLAQLGVSVKP